MLPSLVAGLAVLEAILKLAAVTLFWLALTAGRSALARDDIVHCEKIRNL